MLDDQTYSICEVIGQGSGGTVYKAFHKRLNKYVVIKQIKHNGQPVASNRTEVDLIKGLKHSYIPQVYDFIEQDGETYTVMEYIDGSDFGKLVGNGTRFTKKQILKYAIQLCEAVKYLHSCKPAVIHSDIKPENIMLTKNDDICLIDFNVSLLFDKNGSQAIGGTPGYAPPEQLGIPLADISRGIEGNLPIGKAKMYIDERSDIYSMGAFLYYIMTGERPDTAYNVKPLTELVPQASDGIVHIVSKAMELNPSKRYRSAEEMLTALRNVNKLDKRYVALKIRREIVTAVAAVFVVGGIFLSYQGSGVMEKERDEKFTEYINRAEDFIKQNDMANAEIVIERAEKLYPTRLKPYYFTEKILRSQEKYEECAEYAESVITPEMLADSNNTDRILADMYMLSADSAFELAEKSDDKDESSKYYLKSITLYEKALFYNNSTPECYRDITIAYARTGHIDEAETELKLAMNNGLSDDQLDMLRGEISWSKGEYEKAYSGFESALNTTNDDYIRYRTILVAYKMTGDEANKLSGKNSRMLALLEQQRELVAEKYSRVVTEMLAYEYVQQGEKTGEQECYVKAASCYDDVLKEGKLSYTLQKNYFNILYSKLKDYDRCTALLDIMKNQAEDYWVYMNYCYTCISQEQEKPAAEQSYRKAYEYYLKAEELYDGKSVSDPDMDTLRSTIETLKSFGMIKEN